MTHCQLGIPNHRVWQLEVELELELESKLDDTLLPCQLYGHRWPFTAAQHTLLYTQKAFSNLKVL